MNKYNYSLDWADLAFSSKKKVNELKATFIAAPREITASRFTQLLKEYLPIGHTVLGLAKEKYILGFEGQPHFKTLKESQVQRIIDKVNAASPKHKIYTLSYFQRETNYLLQKLRFSKAIFINGSWQYSFHTREMYYTLVNRKQDFELISPFNSAKEARSYEAKVAGAIVQAFPMPPKGTPCFDEHMMSIANDAAKYSYDYNFQTGAAIGKRLKNSKSYTYMSAAHNTVVPYQTYAMQNGAAREKYFSPPHDLNHYDTVHAEVEIIVKALQNGTDLSGASLFVNLMPCPPCARMLCETTIAEVVYSLDHSDGYAVNMLLAAGKTVRRI